MASEPTHRDLYVTAVQRVAQHPGRDRPLEAYLRAMLGMLEPLADRPELRASEFPSRRGALAAAPVPFDPAWDAVPAAVPIGGATHADVVATLARQAAELRRLVAAGRLPRDDREFGVDAPRGGRWSNFAPSTFVEAGLQGAFGGLALRRAADLPSAERGSRSSRA